MVIDKNKSILIIEDNPGDQLLLQEDLLSTNLLIADITIVDTLADGINAVTIKDFSVIFLDLFLPDSAGLESFTQLIKAKPSIPVIIYSGLSDSTIAVNAITLGAQDFLIKGEYTLGLLEKTVRYSIERKKNLDALQESNERYNLISKATHDMVWDWDLITGEIYRNKEGWRNIFGTPDDKEIGEKEDWWSRIHPDDRKRVTQFNDELILSVNQNLFELEHRIIRDDGTIGYVEDRGYIIRNATGKAIRLIGASQDISERKNAEDELKKLSMVAKETINGVVVSDKNQNVIWVNNAFTRMCGYELDEVMGKNPMHFLTGPDTDPDIVDYVKEQINTKEPFVFEILNYTKTNDTVLVRVQVQPIFNEKGNIKQFFALQTDITKEKELEKKVEQDKIIKQREITEAVFTAQESERSEIGRELHDNVNQLLSATRLYIDMARTNEKERDSLLVSASTYTKDAIEEIRKLSKTLITPLIKEIGLADSVKDLADDIMLVHPIIIRVAVINLIEIGLDYKFKLNIFRIIQEQITNIIKHAKAEEMYINIECDSGKLLVSIADNGVGFDTKMKKTGVGITNIKSRSELYNGDVTLISAPGEGTTLSIAFNKKEIISKTCEMQL